ncbi:MAG: hypothetical protein ABIU05_15145 [Nitrospirales bacterium]
MSKMKLLFYNIRSWLKNWDGVQSSLDRLKQQTETYIQESGRG